MSPKELKYFLLNAWSEARLKALMLALRVHGALKRFFTEDTPK